MSNIWLTSDLHFGHQKEFLWGPRGFSSVQEHDNKIIENWNELIGWDDEVYILGDLMLNDNENGIKIIKNLPGNLHIILGNHDTDTRIELYRSCWNVKEIEYAMPFKYDGYHFFLSHYPTLTSNLDGDKPLRKRVISICGHTHTPDPFADWDKGLIYHVELDAHENKPVLIEDVINDIKGKFI